ncbi:hypothetical protein GIB67_027766 [Kingdonia uniflora]|uniref:Uncharacterized protein n=1 Tax=Kingdonia uniflora TaxID=39325 RepID=A0A7J7PC24_9MAGN|nr:hypothetical protein GIB67_027766 [Kingdonia uniflora]
MEIADIHKEMEEENNGASASEPTKNEESKKKPGSLLMVFRISDSTDVLLMMLGTIGCIADGLSMTAIMVVLSKMMNAFAGASTLILKDVDKVGPLKWEDYADSLTCIRYGFASLDFINPKCLHHLWRTVTAGVCIIYGGLALGSSLINAKYFSEAIVAISLIFEMIEHAQA